MSIFGNLFKARKVIVTRVRTLMKAAAVGRLTEDWNPSTMTGDAALIGRIQLIRDRMRQQELDNDFARGFYDRLENNVLGCEGLSLSVTARNASGALDKKANDAVWSAWKKWCKIGNCTVTWEESFIDVLRLVLRSAARDGGVIIRKRAGTKYGSHKFQLQLFEVDQLDINYTGTAENGNNVFMGVEKDDMGRTVAYHILDRHPGDTVGWRAASRYRQRIEASEIIHYSFRERITSCIGVPRMVAGAATLKQLGEYIYSESVAARAGSSKGGWFQSDRGAKFQGETQYDSEGNPATLNDFEPGSFDELPAGTTFVPYDPKHPTDAFGPFIKTALIATASGVGMSYATLTGDLSETNYSSIRAGKLEEQEAFKRMQKHLIEHFAEIVFSDWLLMALASGAIPGYGVDAFDRLNQPVFRGRRWPWVDPLKDVNASVVAIKNGLTSRTKVIEEQGGVFEDIVEELAAENAIAEKSGVKITDEPEIEPEPEPEEPLEEAEDGERTPKLNGEIRH